MRVIVIDAQNHTIREEKIDGTQTLKELQRIVGGNIDTAFRLFTHDCYVDDEGLLKELPYGFLFDGYGAFAGNGVIVSHDRHGNTTEATLDLELISGRVHWLDIREQHHA